MVDSLSLLTSVGMEFRLFACCVGNDSSDNLKGLHYQSDQILNQLPLRLLESFSHLHFATISLLLVPWAKAPSAGSASFGVFVAK